MKTLTLTRAAIDPDDIFYPLGTDAEGYRYSINGPPEDLLVHPTEVVASASIYRNPQDVVTLEYDDGGTVVMVFPPTIQ